MAEIVVVTLGAIFLVAVTGGYLTYRAIRPPGPAALRRALDCRDRQQLSPAEHELLRQYYTERYARDGDPEDLENALREIQEGK